MPVKTAPMSPTLRHLIVTGGTGYIGARLVDLARAKGLGVTLLTRSDAAPMPGLRIVSWSLGEPLPEDALHLDLPPGAQALIHLAHDWTNAETGAAEDGGLNLLGTRRLLRSARERGLGRLVFVSSQSAREDAINIYGRVKWRIEQELAGEGEVAARVGLVYGGPRRAMYGLLCRLTGLAPVLPMVDPWREVQPIHLDEVGRGLLRLAEDRGGGWRGLAGPEGVPFGEVLKLLARELHGKRLAIVPVPLRLALLACDVVALSPIGPKVDRERVLGLAGTRPLDCARHLSELGLVVTPMAEGLRREPASRRAVLAEGRALLTSVLRARPGPALLRRYLRAVRNIGGGPLALSPLLRRAPGLIRFVEPLSRARPLARRLAIAMTLAEASPEGEAALAPPGRRAGLARLGLDLLLEILALPARALATLLSR